MFKKVYERCLCDQIYDFFKNRFSKYECGFRTNIQNALHSMVGKMPLARDKKEVWGAILTDLPKAFAWLSQA